MFKFVAVFAIIVAAVNAGIIAHAPAAIAVSPAVHAGAVSYQNNNLLAVHPVPVAVAHAPVAVAAPAVAVGIGHGGLALGGLGGFGHGGLLHG